MGNDDTSFLNDICDLQISLFWFVPVSLRDFCTDQSGQLPL